VTFEELQTLVERLRVEERYDAIRVSDDRTQIIAVRQMIFTWAICAGLDECGFSDRWCYETATAAAMAWIKWSGNAGTEPEGWIRHPRSARRRPGGDATREHIAA